MHSALENDKEKIDQGKILNEALNHSISSFSPDLMFEQFVNNYSLAENIYGESLLGLLSGYDPNYLKRNIKIPEFQRELKDRIDKRIKEMKKEKVLDKDESITDKGIRLASVILYMQELDNLVPKGAFGEIPHKKLNEFGVDHEWRDYKRSDRYRDIALKKSVKTSIRRKHKRLEIEDLKTHEKEGKGRTLVIYAIDASGSMKGKKIEAGKKAGIALSYKAIEQRDKVGLIVFGEEIKTAVEPTNDFAALINEFTKIMPRKETDIALTMTKATEMFPMTDSTKHLVLLTDALPTKGKMPEQKTVEAVSAAREMGITTSIIGIGLDAQGKNLAKRMAEMGRGRFYLARNLEEIDRIMLEDYYAVA